MVQESDEREKTTFEVCANNEEWKVDREGTEKAIAMFKTRDEAVDYAVKMAKVEQPSRVLVRASDGSVETEQSFDGEPSPPV